MSKKKAVDYELAYVHKNRPYVTINFLDKKGRTMMSSVDVVLNSLYLTDGADDWDYQKLNGFVRTR
jgi:hypothetical protein